MDKTFTARLELAFVGSVCACGRGWSVLSRSDALARMSIELLDEDHTPFIGVNPYMANKVRSP